MRINTGEIWRNCVDICTIIFDILLVDLALSDLRVLTEVMMNMLTDRQLLILQVIVDDFIHFAQPVGSRSLAKKTEISFSSATIRNEMADLEELGFIEKTHTSSGRIPSEKGYRYYVDHLLSPQKLEKRDIHTIKSIFAERIFELEKIVQKSAKILSELTNYTAIVLGPEVKENKLSKIQIIPLNDRNSYSHYYYGYRTCRK